MKPRTTFPDFAKMANDVESAERAEEPHCSGINSRSGRALADDVVPQLKYQETAPEALLKRAAVEDEDGAQANPRLPEDEEAEEGAAEVAVVEGSVSEVKGADEVEVADEVVAGTDVETDVTKVFIADEARVARVEEDATAEYATASSLSPTTFPITFPSDEVVAEDVSVGAGPVMVTTLVTNCVA